jgi:hypothetical protein
MDFVCIRARPEIADETFALYTSTSQQSVTFNCLFPLPFVLARPPSNSPFRLFTYLLPPFYYIALRNHGNELHGVIFSGGVSNP